MPFAIEFWTLDSNAAIRLRNKNKGFTLRVDVTSGSLPSNPQGRVRWDDETAPLPTGNGKWYSLLEVPSDKEWDRKMRVDYGQTYNGVTLDKDDRPYVWQVSGDSPINFTPFLGLVQLAPVYGPDPVNKWTSKILRDPDNSNKLNENFCTVDGVNGFEIRVQLSCGEWQDAQILVRWAEDKEKLKNDENFGKWFTLRKPTEENANYDAIVRIPYDEYYETSKTDSSKIRYATDEETPTYYFQVRSTKKGNWDCNVDDIVGVESVRKGENWEGDREVDETHNERFPGSNEDNVGLAPSKGSGTTVQQLGRNRNGLLLFGAGVVLGIGLGVVFYQRFKKLSQNLFS